jgi:uncharacterized protein DUF4238
VSKKTPSTRGQQQHYVPAAYLGRFSSDESRRFRERRLWVRDRRADRVFIQPAEKIARKIAIYDVEDDSMGVGRTLDIAWGYEAGLSDSLTALVDRDSTLDGTLWATTLVPFIAGLFVRGPEFQQEYTRRFPKSLERTVPRVAHPDNATAGRLIEFQLLLAPVMTSQWSVLHFTSEVNLVTNDTGYAVASTTLGDSYVVPLDRHTALAVTWSSRKRVLSWVDEHWVAPVEHYIVADYEASDLLRAIGAFARHAVYGPTRDLVEQAAQHLGVASAIGPGLFGSPDGMDLGCHIYDYFRVLSTLQYAPTNSDTAIANIDWPAVEHSWTAPVVVEILFPERTSGGVRENGGHVTIDLAYGIAMRKERRAARDFRMGAMAIMELPFTGVPPEKLRERTTGT